MAQHETFHFYTTLHYNGTENVAIYSFLCVIHKTKLHQYTVLRSLARWGLKYYTTTLSFFYFLSQLRKRSDKSFEISKEMNNLIWWLKSFKALKICNIFRGSAKYLRDQVKSSHQVIKSFNLWFIFCVDWWMEIENSNVTHNRETWTTIIPFFLSLLPFSFSYIFEENS